MRGVSKKADCNKQSAYGDRACTARIYTQEEMFETIKNSMILDSIRCPNAVSSTGCAKPSVNQSVRL